MPQFSVSEFVLFSGAYSKNKCKSNLQFSDESLNKSKSLVIVGFKPSEICKLIRQGGPALHFSLVAVRPFGAGDLVKIQSRLVHNRPA